MSRSHFKQEAPFWRDVYSSPTIESAIYRCRQRRLLALVDSLGLRPGARALEVGCGAGFIAAELARRGYQVCAVDLVEEMLFMTRDLARREDLSRVYPACSDAGALPFRDAEFDLVVGNALLEWLNAPGPALAEISRVLRGGGHVILTATNLWGLHRVLDPRLNPLLEPLKRRGGVVRARAHSRNELARLLVSARLRCERLLTTGFGPFTFLKLKLFPGPRGVRIHQALEGMAGRGMPWLRRGGYAHVVMATKPATEKSPEKPPNAEPLTVRSHSA